MIPLNRTCSIYRGTEGSDIHGMPSETTWALISSESCRVDFMAHIDRTHSRLDRSTVELYPRLEGALFLKKTSSILARDIVVISGADLNTMQFDVEWVDRVDGISSLHHYEAAISSRETPVTLP